MKKIIKKNKYKYLYIKMNDTIVLSSCLFGSYYIFAVSLEFINKSYLENKLIPFKLILLNCLTLGFLEL